MSGWLDMMRLFYHRRFFSERQIQHYQLKQIQNLINNSILKAPYYQTTFKDYPLNNLDDFSRFPLMDKRILMDEFDTINTVGLYKDDVSGYALKKEADKDFLGYYRDQYVIGLSSGTSGNKGLYVTDKAMTQKLPFVFLARSGLPLRLLPYRILFCLRVFSQGFDDINSPLIKLHYASTMTEVGTLIEKINAHRINILMAPPSLVRLLLSHADEIQIKLKRIVCYAEVLEKEEKLRFETIFNTKVIEIYQASEGQMASACRYGNLHINEDLVYVELLDDKGQKITDTTQPSSMVITNLVNQIQPLIRYRMNDLIVLKESCPCGSHFRVIDHIVGRHDDVLVFINRQGKHQTVFPDLMSRWIITSTDDIREFRVSLINKKHLLIEFECFDPSDSMIQTCKSILDKRLHQELNAWDIDCTIELIHCKIELGIDKHKMKRFISKDER
ncbi:MAG: F390 synthetase-related protein [Erysipelotrichaceae bacterium]